MICDLLNRKGIDCSYGTVYSYMRELGIKAIVRRKKRPYTKGYQHHIFDNLVDQHFIAAKPNQIWCTDFTYLSLKNGAKRYNCSIIDLYDRSIVASLNSKWIDSNLAIETLKIALEANRINEKLMTLDSELMKPHEVIVRKEKSVQADPLVKVPEPNSSDSVVTIPITNTSNPINDNPVVKQENNKPTSTGNTRRRPSQKGTTTLSGQMALPGFSDEQKTSAKRKLDDDFVDELRIRGVEYIDNRVQSKIIWVLYNKEERGFIETLLSKYKYKAILEKRGAVATHDRPAWRVMLKEE